MYLCVYMYACVKEAFSLSWESDSWLLSPPSLASYVSPRRAPLPTLTGLPMSVLAVHPGLFLPRCGGPCMSRWCPWPGVRVVVE